MTLLADYFSRSSIGADLSTNQFFLGHIAELGWVLNEAILDRGKDTGLYIPTTDWTERGETAAAVVMTYLNIQYNYQDGFRQSELLKSLFCRVNIAVCTQFWQYREFANVKCSEALDRFNEFFPIANKHYDEPSVLVAAIGLAAQKASRSESDAMIRFSAYTEGVISEFFGRE